MSIDASDSRSAEKLLRWLDRGVATVNDAGSVDPAAAKTNEARSPAPDPAKMQAAHPFAAFIASESETKRDGQPDVHNGR